MKIVIQVAADDDVKAWALLQRHSAGVALPHRTFVISEEAASSLRQAGIRFTQLASEAPTFSGEGVAVGERI